MKLCNEAIKLIEKTLEKGSTILELGSGDGTLHLIKKGYKVISIEHDPAWQFKYHDNYIAAPNKKYEDYWWKYEDYWWFDSEYLSELPAYDFLLIDGPTGPPVEEYDNCRIGLLYHKHLFNLEVPILVDDTGRPSERELAEELIKNREYTDHGRFIFIHGLLEE